ncbi:uncharacterized protein PGTG_21117 [Puccinia graminis f. sp. tritici CRL 75-36-700-3]|uniref:Uncharacterized protein n=1 Tax=Puccinia graminis f. sp. tritici (strain CRL 75-36-700-3 / race SCCL) TaxID=418459 RepID=H6QQG0_PUCGT|nr:uncharacterized protein PGTG_21117 [Puccinia graminis f. sp. tritici CRL 75-36-700-3]EHS62571.1 hypothetical protein PGTG_21117 [Puccinia graminis f. sp. tritici CRL 75-36-700-3]
MSRRKTKTPQQTLLRSKLPLLILDMLSVADDEGSDGPHVALQEVAFWSGGFVSRAAAPSYQSTGVSVCVCTLCVVRETVDENT